MIKRFDTFVNDLITESMMESKIEFSEKFIKLIKKIRSNKIAQKLLQIQTSGSVANFTQNYIDTTDVKDELTFITSRKIKEILNSDVEMIYRVDRSERFLTHGVRNHNLFRRLNYTIPNTPRPYNPPAGTLGIIKAEAVSSTSDNIYAWFVSQDGQETVINKNSLVPHNNKMPLLWQRHRSRIKVGRLVRSILTTIKFEFTEKDIEDFVNAYKSTFDIMENALHKFKVVTGKDIAHWYNKRNYENGGTSQLGNSCMAGVSPEYFDIYTKNSKCSLLILFSEIDGQIIDGQYVSSKIKGRALVWETKQGDIFLDRIYTNEDSDVSLFKSYAHDKGWWYKTSQATSNSFSVSNGSTSKSCNYSVELEESKFNYYPYLDSLSYINFDQNLLSNTTSLLTRIQADLHSTGGYLELHNRYQANWIIR